MNQVRVERAPTAVATRVCRDCGRELPLADYPCYSPGRPRPNCRACRAAYERARVTRTLTVGEVDVAPRVPPAVRLKPRRVSRCERCGSRWLERDEDGDPTCGICGWFPRRYRPA
jgi:hypothetical protein